LAIFTQARRGAGTSTTGGFFRYSQVSSVGVIPVVLVSTQAKAMDAMKSIVALRIIIFYQKVELIKKSTGRYLNLVIQTMTYFIGQ
jgi:hypothetical protein